MLRWRWWRRWPRGRWALCRDAVMSEPRGGRGHVLPNIITHPAGLEEHTPPQTPTLRRRLMSREIRSKQGFLSFFLVCVCVCVCVCFHCLFFFLKKPIRCDVMMMGLLSWLHTTWEAAAAAAAAAAGTTRMAGKVLRGCRLCVLFGSSARGSTHILQGYGSPLGPIPGCEWQTRVRIDAKGIQYYLSIGGKVYLLNQQQNKATHVFTALQ